MRSKSHLVCVSITQAHTHPQKHTQQQHQKHHHQQLACSNLRLSLRRDSWLVRGTMSSPSTKDVTNGSRRFWDRQGGQPSVTQVTLSRQAATHGAAPPARTAPTPPTSPSPPLSSDPLEEEGSDRRLPLRPPLLLFFPAPRSRNASPLPPGTAGFCFRSRCRLLTAADAAPPVPPPPPPPPLLLDSRSPGPPPALPRSPAGGVSKSIAPSSSPARQAATAPPKECPAQCTR